MMGLANDQRSSRRIQAIGLIVFEIDGRSFEAAPLDVSVGGAATRLLDPTDPRRPWPGARVRVGFIRPRGRPAFSVPGVVVRVSDDGKVSVRFETDQAGAARLETFLQAEAQALGIPISALLG